MSKEHDQLKAHGKSILKEMGYKEDEIQEEYRLHKEGMKQKLIIDVVGIRKGVRWNDTGRSTAIECGQCDAQKISWLNLYFDDVIHLPFLEMRDTSKIPETVKELIEMRLSDYQTDKMKELQEKVIALTKAKEGQTEEIERLKEVIKDGFDEAHAEFGKKVMVALLEMDAFPRWQPGDFEGDMAKWEVEVQRQRDGKVDYKIGFYDDTWRAERKKYVTDNKFTYGFKWLERG